MRVWDHYVLLLIEVAHLQYPTTQWFFVSDIGLWMPAGLVSAKLRPVYIYKEKKLK
jgi:hypothetical protein